MKKITLFFLILTGLLLVTKSAHAENVAGHSATLNLAVLPLNSQTIRDNELIKKKAAIQAVLERYNSPLAQSTSAFIDACKSYDLDCYLLPAISGLESTYGHYILPGTHNPFGWGGGRIYFKSWDDGIMTVGRGLRMRYINSGANSIEAIGHIYSESPTWAARVRIIMHQFEEEEQKNGLFFTPDSVKL